MNQSVIASNVNVFGIPNCDTVKKARSWLAAQGVGYVFHDFKKSGAPAGLLPMWIAAVGWEKLLNRKGRSWRALDPATQVGVIDAASATAVMLAQPSMIKRPVVQWRDGSITVGFDASSFSARLT